MSLLILPDDMVRVIFDYFNNKQKAKYTRICKRILHILITPFPYLTSSALTIHRLNPLKQYQILEHIDRFLKDPISKKWESASDSIYTRWISIPCANSFERYIIHVIARFLKLYHKTYIVNYKQQRHDWRSYHPSYTLQTDCPGCHRCMKFITQKCGVVVSITNLTHTKYILPLAAQRGNRKTQETLETLRTGKRWIRSPCKP